MDTQILIVLAILAVTVILLTFDVFRLDIVALLCLLALGWSGVLSPGEALSGFSSQAVIAMLAVMIMSRGIAVTGLMDRFARNLSRRVGTHRRRTIAILSGAIGLLSGLIQNIGAAAMFLPGALGVSRRSRIPVASLIMPIGFAAILGGTLTMVGSGPLILTNDLLSHARLAPYGLFSVTPVGLALLAAGILYFVFFGEFVLPVRESSVAGASPQQKLIEALHVPHHIRHYVIPQESPLVGKTSEQCGAWDEYGINFLSLSRKRGVIYAPCRDTRFAAGHGVAILGEEENILRFAREFTLTPRHNPGEGSGLGDPARSGFAEVIIPPRSEMVGQSLREYSLRRRHEVEPVMLISRGEEIHGDFSDHHMESGDTLVVFGLWEKIGDLGAGNDFVVATPFKVEKTRKGKSLTAALCFLFAVGLALSGSSIAVAFLTGAVAMVVTGVLGIEEAYRAVEWKVVFLLAGLIPLGFAMQKSGAAEFLATAVMGKISGMPSVVLLLAVALLATLFSIFMSNVGAVVVLAPLVISMAEIGGLDPRPLVLLAAVCAANSFVLPTHQVNALLMSAGGYRNRDYLRAGGGMTVAFLLIVVPLFYLFYI